MHYYEVTVVEYNEHNGYYYKEDTTCKCVALLKFIASYYASLWAMKSWISNFLQPWQSVPTTTKSPVSPSNSLSGTKFSTAQSQPIQINMGVTQYPGANLYDTCSMGTASDPYHPTKNICQTTVSLGYIALGATTQCKTGICKRALLAVSTPPCVSSVSKLKNGLLQSSLGPDRLYHSSMWNMLHLPHSAPGSLCMDTKMPQSVQKSGAFCGVNTSVIVAEDMLGRVVHCDSTNMQGGLLLDDHCGKENSNNSDVQREDAGMHANDAPAHGEEPQNDNTPSFMSCKNPFISYILGCSVDDTGATPDDEPWSEVESDDDESDVFQDGCEGVESDKCSQSYSSSPAMSDLSLSDMVSIEECCSQTGTDNELSRFSSSSSDYWSEDQCDEQDTTDDEPGMLTPKPCKLLKPFCTNPIINFILNCSDQEDETELQDLTDDVTPLTPSFCHARRSGPAQSRLTDINAGTDCRDEPKPRRNAARRACKVTFTDEPPTVHHMYTWSFAYRQSRKGPWECHARDRDRFRARILEVERAISWCFLPRHRACTWKRLGLQ